MSTLRELTSDQLKLKALVESGDLTEEMAADTFEGIEHEINEKISNYCHVLNSLESDLTAITNEQTRLKTLESQKKNEIKRLKERLIFGLNNAEINKFDTGLFKGHMRKGVVSVNVINADDIPEQFVEEVITKKVDKTAIKNAIKSGEDVSGAELFIGNVSLVIK